MKIVLASKSPRRKELLSALYPDFEIITADVDESLTDGVHPSVGVGELAVRKGRAVLPFVPEDGLVISSDTLVELGGVPFGKPVSQADAERMLRELSGKSHSVHTGVAVHYKGRVFSGVDSTRVRFRELSESEICGYISCGEPMDKAGAYAIQGKGSAFVEGIEGDFDTVVGLSMRLLKELIKEATDNE